MLTMVMKIQVMADAGRFLKDNRPPMYAEPNASKGVVMSNGVEKSANSPHPLAIECVAMAIGTTIEAMANAVPAA